MAADFAGLLNSTIGLDAASIGASAIERAIRARQESCRVPCRDAYWELVRGSADELQALVDAVVVPETWFFREPDAFAALGAFARETWQPAPRGGVLRALSLPCSTGEEPYSMAMALLDAGVPGTEFRIEGIDVSLRALQDARTAAYRKGSFRGTPPGLRARYFERAGDRHRVVERVRRQVTFRHGNVLNAESLPGAGTYHVVFCRNVLIYFDRESQSRAVAVLTRLLEPGGLIFVSPAESSVLLSHGFVAAGTARGQAFRLRGTRAHVAARAVPRVTARPAVIVSTSQPSPAPQERMEPQAAMQAAIALANAGRFAEAAARCEEHLLDYGPSAQAFYLLGLVRDAGGERAAAQACYRKALYLEPQHHDALLQLALLMEAEHNHAEAARLRGRAERASRQERRP